MGLADDDGEDTVFVGDNDLTVAKRASVERSAGADGFGIEELEESCETNSV